MNSPDDARTLAIERQFPSESSVKKSLLAIIERLGYVQIDTISIVERSHHHILWSRFPAYNQAMLDKMLEKDRSIFEYWSHAASYLPMKDYRFSLPRKISYTTRHKDWRSSNKKLIRLILDRIRAEGPLSSREFDGKSTGASGWWNHKPAKAALEFLFHSGDLMVSARKNFAKLYDLPERVLPSSVITDIPGRTDFFKHLITRCIDAQGIVSDLEILHLQGKSDKDYLNAVKELEEDGRIVSVSVEGLDNLLFRTRESFLEKIRSKSLVTTRILSPFDNTVIHRARLKRLFGFSYTLECYLPEEKRKFGYFCLPVLRGNGFIGMLDCKAHRKGGVLEVISAHPVGMHRNKFIEFAKDSLHELAQFADCETVKISSRRKTRT
ncbi:MAG: YcaQ family DNA glycosylase [Ignavibacteria bacterium]|nr:YcaQ family DNA glycosylase [Ignavibacteria bacterium]